MRRDLSKVVHRTWSPAHICDTILFNLLTMAAVSQMLAVCWAMSSQRTLSPSISAALQDKYHHAVFDLEKVTDVAQMHTVPPPKQVSLDALALPHPPKNNLEGFSNCPSNECLDGSALGFLVHSGF